MPDTYTYADAFARADRRAVPVPMLTAYRCPLALRERGRLSYSPPIDRFHSAVPCVTIQRVNTQPGGVRANRTTAAGDDAARKTVVLGLVSELGSR